MASKYPWNKKIIPERKAGAGLKDLALKYGDYEEEHPKFNGVYAYFRRKLKDIKVDEEVTKAIQDKATKKVIEEKAKETAELKKEYIKIFTNIRRATANELFNGHTNFNRLKELKISTEILRNCRIEDWSVREIKDLITREKDKLELRRLELEIEERESGEGKSDGLEALAKAISDSAKRLNESD